MHQTVKILTITATLAVSCSLPYANAGKIDYPHELKPEVQRVNFDMAAVAPIAFLGFPREFKAEVERVSVNMPSVAPVTFLDLPRELKAEGDRVSPNRPSAKPAAFFSYPRELKVNVERISFNTPSLAPMAFVKFCLQYPHECKVRRMAFRRNPMTLTKARWDELEKVNRDVNRAIRPQANVNGVMAEEWLVSPRAGDCNDYAVTKRHELLARGWPSRSLVLAEVVIPSGEHHLVLVVRTREDDFVLDNLSANVRPVSQIRYQWVRAQQASNPKFWSTISVTKVARVAMAAR
jgi:predicted transglutaminase-like cysteine proteinase